MGRCKLSKNVIETLYWEIAVALMQYISAEVYYLCYYGVKNDLSCFSLLTLEWQMQ